MKINNHYFKQYTMEEILKRKVKGIWVPIEVWEDTNLNWNEKILFLEIDSYTTKDKDCYVSNEYIAKLLHVNETTANKILSSLIKKGYVIKTKFDGRRRFVKSSFSFKDGKIFHKKKLISYKDQLKDKRWKKLANKIIKIDNYTCQLCGSHEHLQVHHKKYIKDRLAWEYDEENLITLCSECHKKVHHLK